MKISLLTASALFLFSFSNAQENCAALKITLDQKESTIATQISKISKLEKDIEYYITTLNLMSSSIIVNEKDVNFKINSVIGNSTTGKVVIEGILVNNGVARSLQNQQATCIDPQGNIEKSFQMSLGGENRIKDLNVGVPVKFTVEFTTIMADATDIKQLVVTYHSNVNHKSDPITVTFKNLSIDWK